MTTANSSSVEWAWSANNGRINDDNWWKAFTVDYDDRYIILKKESNDFIKNDEFNV